MAAKTSPAMRIKDRAEWGSMPKPLTFPPDALASDAIAAMCEKNYGSVIIIDPDEKVIGVFTERDVMKKLVNGHLVPDETRLSEVMTTNPRLAHEDDDVVDWLRIMSNERFRRLPVVDSEGRIKAVFTQGDFVSYTWPELMHQATQLARSTLGKNWHYFLIGGAVLLYTLATMVLTAVMGR